MHDRSAEESVKYDILSSNCPVEAFALYIYTLPLMFISSAPSTRQLHRFDPLGYISEEPGRPHYEVERHAGPQRQRIEAIEEDLVRGDVPRMTAMGRSE